MSQLRRETRRVLAAMAILALLVFTTADAQIRRPSSGGGISVEADPNALHKSGGTMTGILTADNDSVDVITIPTYLNNTTDSPSLRFTTQGTRVAPWRIFNIDAGGGFHDHALLITNNLTYDRTNGYTQDVTTQTPLASSAPVVRWAFESSFTSGDPNVLRGTTEFNLDIDPNFNDGVFQGGPSIRPFAFYYDWDIDRTEFQIGVFEDPNSAAFSLSSAINLQANTNVIRMLDRTRVNSADPSDINTPGRIVFDPGFRGSASDRAVLIRNQFPDGHLHIESGVDPNTSANGFVFVGISRRADTIFGPFASAAAHLLINGQTALDQVQLRVRGTASQSNSLILAETSAGAHAFDVTPAGLATLNAGVEFTDDDTDTTCGAGNYNIYADTSETKLKACQNGVRADVAVVLSGSGTLDFPTTAIATCDDLTVTVTGAADGDVVSISPVNASVPAGSQFSAWTSAANTVTVRHCCNGAANCDPASGTFKARVFKP